MATVEKLKRNNNRNVVQEYSRTTPERRVEAFLMPTVEVVKSRAATSAGEDDSTPATSPPPITHTISNLPICAFTVNSKMLLKSYSPQGTQHGSFWSANKIAFTLLNSLT